MWRRATNREPRPAEVPEILRPTTEGIWERTNGLEGNLERAKVSHKGNKIYGTDASPWGQFRSCGTAQTGETERWGGFMRGFDALYGGVLQSHRTPTPVCQDVASRWVTRMM